jgi:VanZ family protein
MVWRGLPALLWAGLLWTVSGTPAAGLPPLFPGADKLAHLAAYAVLGLLLARIWPVTAAAGARQVLTLGTAYGITDEIHQYFVAGRTTETGDMAADWLGVALAVWLLRRRAEVRR